MGGCCASNGPLQRRNIVSSPSQYEPLSAYPMSDEQGAITMQSDPDDVHPAPLSSGMPSFSVGLSAPGAEPLAPSEARFRALAQATGQIYWITDAHGYL